MRYVLTAAPGNERRYYEVVRCSPLIVVVKLSIVPLRVGGAQGTSGKEQTLLLGWVIISPSDSHKGKGR